MPNPATTKPPTDASLGPPSQKRQSVARPSLHLDVEEWLPYLDDPDATYDEKRELIETLWGIVLSFVDLGWDITTETAASSKLPPDKTVPSIDLTRALHDAVVRSDDHQQQMEEV